jgi:membrane protein implicated in regulation of membrane protease activity
MHNFEFGPSSGGGQFESQAPGEPPRNHSVLSLIILICLVAGAAVIGLGLLFWVLGFAFHVAGLLLRIAIITAVVAFIWRRVVHGRSRRSC